MQVEHSCVFCRRKLKLSKSQEQRCSLTVYAEIAADSTVKRLFGVGAYSRKGYIYNNIVHSSLTQQAATSNRKLVFCQHIHGT